MGVSARVTVWAAVMIAWGCGARAVPGSGAGEPSASLAARLPIPLDVRNDNMQDVTIYVVHGGIKTRLGYATAASLNSFAFPASFSEGAVAVRFLAVPVIGGRAGFRRSVLSEPISVRLGERVAWTLEPDLARSIITVYASTMAPPADSTQPADSLPPVRLLRWGRPLSPRAAGRTVTEERLHDGGRGDPPRGRQRRA